MEVKAKKQKAKDVVKSISDEVGNLVIVKNNGKRIILTLKLVAETRFRKIGVVNLAQKSFEVKRKREKHRFRKTNSYGFNSKLLHDAKLFDTIRLSDETARWVIPVSFVLENGTYLNFKKEGFETQIFINLDKIEPFKKTHII